MKQYESDMCSGAIFKKILLFSIPLMFSSILQLLYNMVDIIVVGQFAGKEALAAVGSTSSLINLITNLFIGVSEGTCIVIATYYGAQKYDRMSKSVHTSVAIAFLSGVVLALVGYFASEFLLGLMGTPSDVIKLSTLYMKIYFLGMPFFMVFNFGSSILNAMGDTKRPLYYLTVSGIVNVVLNLVFVIYFKQGVKGVAIATVVSQIISSVLIVNCLVKIDGVYRLNVKELKIDKTELLNIFKNGIPCGISRSLFSFSNVIVQSSINSFGTVVVAGNSAATNINGFIYGCLNSFLHASTSFISYSVGAKRFDRIKKIVLYCLVDVCIIWGISAVICLLFGKLLLGIYAPGNLDVINKGFVKILIVGCTYGLCGLMEVMTGALRGIGYSFVSMIICFAGVCGIRILWVLSAFRVIGTLESLFVCFPLSWIGTFLLEAAMLVVCYKRLVKKESNNEKGECLDAARC